jgi:hypothetical protein
MLNELFERSRERNIEFSIKATSIFYNKEKKLEYYYNYFEKKGFLNKENPVFYSFNLSFRGSKY